MTKQNKQLLEQAGGDSGILGALAGQFAAFIGGYSMGKLFRNIKGFFSGASARADNFSEDPVAQVLYQNHISKAYKSARNAKNAGQVEQAFNQQFARS